MLTQNLTSPHIHKYKIHPYHIVPDTESNIDIYLDSQDAGTVSVRGRCFDPSLTELLSHLHCYTCGLYLKTMTAFKLTLMHTNLQGETSAISYYTKHMH